jgi:cytochrome bd-type quinol oxidase subunit 2
MIQRKQTIYLFFAGLITVVLLFIPFGKLFIEGSPCFEYNAFVVKTISEQTVIMSAIGNVFLLIITSVLSFITIFLYKKRKLQLKLISINMLIILATIVTIVYVYPNFIFPKNINLADAKLEYNYIIIISFVSAVGLYFAKKAIMKDEAMIRSADRLR